MYYRIVISHLSSASHVKCLTLLVWVNHLPNNSSCTVWAVSMSHVIIYMFIDLCPFIYIYIYGRSPPNIVCRSAWGFQKGNRQVHIQVFFELFGAVGYADSIKSHVYCAFVPHYLHTSYKNICARVKTWIIYVPMLGHGMAWSSIH